MKTLAVVCLMFGCLVSVHATYGKRKYPGNQMLYCYDYLGRPVQPGEGYFDGCNTCLCGPYGEPAICTLIYCGNRNTGRPVYPVNPMNPGFPGKPRKY